MITETEYQTIKRNIGDLITISQLSREAPSFSRSKLNSMFLAMDKYPHLEDTTTRTVDGRLLINRVLFGAWLCNQLPSQQENQQH